VLSGIDSDLKSRKFIIYRGTQNAMTSGKHASSGWRIRVNHTDKWSNPLMGWVSSMETVSPIQRDLKFESAEQAIMFCERNGLNYEVNKGATTPDKAGQVDNQIFYVILPKDVQARMKALGVRKSRSIWENPDNLGKSHFVNFRRTQFGSEPWRPATYQTEEAWQGPAWEAKRPTGEDSH
jgi:ETC complex I subunit conserved region